MNSKSSLIRRLFYQYYSDLFYRNSIFQGIDLMVLSWKHIIFHALSKRLDFIFFFLSFFKKRSLFIIKRGD